jgi:hypothetical protein
MIRSTHFAIQLSADFWLVTFVSEIGITETRRMTSAEFIAMIKAESLMA